MREVRLSQLGAALTLSQGIRRCLVSAISLLGRFAVRLSGPCAHHLLHPAPGSSLGSWLCSSTSMPLRVRSIILWHAWRPTSLCFLRSMPASLWDHHRVPGPPPHAGTLPGRGRGEGEGAGAPPQETNSGSTLVPATLFLLFSNRGNFSFFLSFLSLFLPSSLPSFLFVFCFFFFKFWEWEQQLC